MRWDAARTASRRPLTKPRKLHGPVGDEALNFRVEPGCFGEKRWRRTADDACEDCGYHVCSCDRTTALEALREHGVISEVGLYDELLNRYPPRGCSSCGRSDGAHATDCRAIHEAVHADAARFPPWTGACVQRDDAVTKPHIEYETTFGKIKVVVDPFVYSPTFSRPPTR